MTVWDSSPGSVSDFLSDKTNDFISWDRGLAIYFLTALEISKIVIFRINR